MTGVKLEKRTSMLKTFAGSSTFSLEASLKNHPPDAVPLVDVTSTRVLSDSAAPFVMSFFPSERAKAAGAPVTIDISKLETGQKIDVEWRGKVVWIVSRTGDRRTEKL